MTGRIIQRVLFILPVLLAALLHEACWLNVPGAIPTCTGSNLDQFEGCFGDPEGDYIRIIPGDPPADSEFCSDFLFSGHGSGIFRSPGDSWDFTGALADEDTVEISGRSFSDTIHLTSDSVTGRLIVKIWDEDETSLEDDTLKTRMGLDRYACF